MTQIRLSRASDIAGIAAIYAHHVLTGTGTFETVPPTEDEMRSRREDVLNKGLPFLVAEASGQLLGFAYCNWFKPRPAFRFSAEDSIYLAPEAMGRGVGTWLLTELMAQAEQRGVRKLIAVIGDSANHGSIALHARCGYQSAGLISSCGWKFDRWLDIVLMEKALGEGHTTPPSEATK
jgi:L-amino acid N-acyltransferase YncA